MAHANAVKIRLKALEKRLQEQEEFAAVPDDFNL